MIAPRIENRTWWRTDQLARIVTRVLREEGWSDQRIRAARVEIEFRRTRGAGSSGWGRYHADHFLVRIARLRRFLDLPDFCHVVAHEAGHNDGHPHGPGGMREDLRAGVMRRKAALANWGWALAIDLQPQAKHRAAFERAHSKEEAVQARYRADLRTMRRRLALSKAREARARKAAIRSARLAVLARAREAKAARRPPAIEAPPGVGI
jgi:hypothetical protein